MENEKPDLFINRIPLSTLHKRIKKCSLIILPDVHGFYPATYKRARETKLLKQHSFL
jgi:hypothetical protein